MIDSICATINPFVVSLSNHVFRADFQ